jgi:hypothetical protein
MQINENVSNKVAAMRAAKADQYRKQYKNQMDALEKSPLAKTRGIRDWDHYCLGSMIESYKVFEQYVTEADGSANDLGTLPQIAMSVLTATYGAGVIPAIASVQPIEEESGIVYFRNVYAGDTKGNATAGDKLQNPVGPQKSLSGYSVNGFSEVADTGDGSTTSFSGTLTRKPRRQRVAFFLTATPAIFCKDQGDGTLLGKGCDGTIDYETGDWTLDFAVAPANAATITAEYQENYELSDDVPKIESRMETKPVTADMYALKMVGGIFNDFILNKRFGMDAASESAKELAGELQKEQSSKLIKLLRTGSLQTAADQGGGITFDRQYPQNIAEAQHRDAISYRFSEVGTQLVDAAGRGRAQTWVIGNQIASDVESLPGFTPISDGLDVGPHIFGTYKGVTVIRVPEAATLGGNESTVMWKGSNPFEAPVVWAPYMPLATTDKITTGRGNNPLTHQKAVASMSACESLVPQYSTTFDFENAYEAQP